jgi:enoyl-CoA hydratase
VKILTERLDEVLVVTINRPEVKNAVDSETAEQLADAFRMFDADESLLAAVLCGSGGTFCSGADLKAFSRVSVGERNHLELDMLRDGPMGPTRMHLSKPVIAAVSGYAVAGGLELALWCDLRIVEKDAVFGVFCRRFGIPLIDGGTQRLPRLIGMSRALDMILTGRPVSAGEAFSMGLANRVVEKGQSVEAAVALAKQITKFPQACMRSDREAAYKGFDLPFNEAMAQEFSLGLQVIQSGESEKGASQFVSGTGRHGVREQN